MKGKNKEIIIAHPLDKLWMLPNNNNNNNNKLLEKSDGHKVELGYNKYYITIN